METGSQHKNIGSSVSSGLIRHSIGTPEYVLALIKKKLNMDCLSIVPFNFQVEQTGLVSNMQNTFNELCWDIFNNGSQRAVFYGDILASISDNLAGNVGSARLSLMTNKTHNDPATLVSYGRISSGNGNTPNYFAKDLLLSAIGTYRSNINAPIIDVSLTGYLARIA